MPEAEIIVGILAIAIGPHQPNKELGELIRTPIKPDPTSRNEMDQHVQMEVGKPIVKIQPHRLLIRRDGKL